MTISAVIEVCEEPEPETWAELAASSSVWGERRRAARHVHLDLLKKHGVYEELPPSAGDPADLCTLG